MDVRLAGAIKRAREEAAEAKCKQPPRQGRTASDAFGRRALKAQTLSKTEAIWSRIIMGSGA